MDPSAAVLSTVPPQPLIGFPLRLENVATTGIDRDFNVGTSKFYQEFRFEPSAGSSTDPPGRRCYTFTV